MDSSWDKLIRPMRDTSIVVKGTSGRVDSQKLLTQMGALMLGQAQKAFTDQAFDKKPWKPRYPNQSQPKINVAGAVSDLAKGPAISPRRFDDRPAVQDTNTLKRSLAPRSGYVSLLGAFVIEVGTTVHYAGVHQWGGVTRLPITRTVAENYFKWKEKEVGARDRARKALNKISNGFVGYAEAKNKYTKASGRVLAAVRYLEPKLQGNVLITKVNQRQFLGMTAELGKKFTDLIQGKIGGVGRTA